MIEESESVGLDANAYVAADTVLPTLGLVAQAEIDAFHRDNDRL